MQPLIREIILILSFGMKFKDVYTRDGLLKLDRIFLAYLSSKSKKAFDDLQTLRSKSDKDINTLSCLIIELAPFVDDFLRELFLLPLRPDVEDLACVYRVKRQYVQRVFMKHKGVSLEALDEKTLHEKMNDFLGQPFDEILFARTIETLAHQGPLNPETLDFLSSYSLWAHQTEAGKAYHRSDIIFKAPGKLDSGALVQHDESVEEGIQKRRVENAKARDGFNLIDAGLTKKDAYNTSSYCIKCHTQEKDSCSKGMIDTNGDVKNNALGHALRGCPLKQKISEMMTVFEQGYLLGALSIVMIDNPLLAMTGYRICNDCMKACIFQKQDPVDIPGVETYILKSTLDLPFGFEIYSLLTRWNPLKFDRFIPQMPMNSSVMVVGLGPAGIALSYYLLQAGVQVIAVEGTKIEPMPVELVGDHKKGVPFEPIKSIAQIFETLEDRTLQGMGGVMEYGITVRWDKNLLTVMRLILERDNRFGFYDGIQFGGTLGFDEAKTMGVDHVALCIGAGEPKIPPIERNFLKGVRFASDFLMSLQLSGAYKKDSLVNCDIELPLVVVGAGLTAVDAATEALAYYPRLIERFERTYHSLVKRVGESQVRACWNAEELERAQRYLLHAEALQRERVLAHAENRAPNFMPLLRAWGGVTMVSRTAIQETQSYKLNHEELQSAMNQGVDVVDHFTPHAFAQDPKGHVTAVEGFIKGEPFSLKARSVLIATGTRDNTVLNDERIVLQDQGDEADFVTQWGDYNPVYAGSVVKAIASVKNHVGTLLAQLRQKVDTQPAKESLNFEVLDARLRARVASIRSLAPNITELVVKAPCAAERAQPGQFFKVQLYHGVNKDKKMLTKAVALSRAWVDPIEGHIGFIVLEHGLSTQLIKNLRVGQHLHLMGPTGAPTLIDPVKTLLMIGGGLGNAVLFSVGQHYRAAGTRVIYLAAYKNEASIFKLEDIEAAADVVLWAVEQGDTFKPRRDQDHLIKGTVIDAFNFFMTSDWSLEHQGLEKILVIGSEGLIWAVKNSIDAVASHFPQLKSAVVGVNSPMQCMMKGICGQCVQKHVDPKTREEYFVFSCKNQDQNYETLDTPFLASRLSQNRTSEKLQTLLFSRDPGVM